TCLLEKLHFRQIILNLRENTEYAMCRCRSQSVFEQCAQNLLSGDVTIGHRCQIGEIPGDVRGALAHLGKAEQVPVIFADTGARGGIDGEDISKDRWEQDAILYRLQPADEIRKFVLPAASTSIDGVDDSRQVYI